MKIVLTGAHFTPALAVMTELKQIPEVDLVYIGRFHTIEGDKAYSAESRIIPEYGVKFYGIDAGRIQKYFSMRAILSILKIPIGIVQAFWILLKEQPDTVVSFGGYISVPVVFCAWLLSIPIVIHEQTLVSGLANRVGFFFADRICLGFKQNTQNDQKVVFTGNPIRQEVFEQALNKDFTEVFTESKKHKLPIILITGGNQGSHLINIQIEAIISKLFEIACVIHQTGESEFRDYDRLILKKSARYLPIKWINSEIGTVLSRTDILIGRAGINTLLEAAYWGIPSLVIPIPYLYGDEQHRNAEYFKDLGLCDIIEQKDISTEVLFNKVQEMIKRLTRLKIVAKKAGSVVVKDAAKRIVAEILSV